MRFFRILNIPRKVEEITVTIIQRDQKQNNFLAANKTNLGARCTFLGGVGNLDNGDRLASYHNDYA